MLSFAVSGALTHRYRVNAMLMLCSRYTKHTSVSTCQQRAWAKHLPLPGRSCCLSYGTQQTCIALHRCCLCHVHSASTKSAALLRPAASRILSMLSSEQSRTARSYIISQGDVRCLGVLVELMMGVCDPTVLNGESGYYLTVLGAALSVRKQYLAVI